MTETIRVDLHVHSNRSPDGSVAVDRLVARAPEVGLAGLALTDHNTVAGHVELAAAARDHAGLRLLPGVEVSTVEGHLLAFGVSAAPPAHRPIGETVEWITSRGGEAALAHPLRWSHGVGRGVARSVAVRAIETVNGHNWPGANRRAAAIARERGLSETGGSDAHDLAGLGRTYTEFPADAVTVDQLLEAIRRGRTSGGGSPIPAGDRLRLLLRTGRLRLARGLRPI